MKPLLVFLPEQVKDEESLANFFGFWVFFFITIGVLCLFSFFG